MAGYSNYWIRSLLPLTSTHLCLCLKQCPFAPSRLPSKDCKRSLLLYEALPEFLTRPIHLHSQLERKSGLKSNLAGETQTGHHEEMQTTSEALLGTFVSRAGARKLHYMLSLNPAAHSGTQLQNLQFKDGNTEAQGRQNQHLPVKGRRWSQVHVWLYCPCCSVEGREPALSCLRVPE